MSIQPWQADQPYNALPLLPPQTDIESRAVLKQCIKARAALAELKQAAELIPNQSVLINTLPLLCQKMGSETNFYFHQSLRLVDRFLMNNLQGLA